MRPMRSTFLLFVTFLISIPVAAQQPPQRDPQAIALLQRAYALLSGGQAIRDVTLTGTARRIAGSDNETGMATLKGLATGEARMDFSFPSGTRREARANSINGPVGSWSGPDATSHPIPQHNLMTDSSWFFPAFALGRLLSQGDYALSFVGTETREARNVAHVSAIRQLRVAAAPAGWTSARIQRLSETQIYVDSTSLLPSAVSFNTHPDNNETIDIPVEFRFSSYQNVGGLLIPFHIQKYLNNSLALDIQIDVASPNSGLTATSFTISVATRGD